MEYRGRLSFGNSDSKIGSGSAFYRGGHPRSFVLWNTVAATAVERGTGACRTGGADGEQHAAWQIALIFSKSGRTEFRQWTGDCAVLAAGSRAGTWLAGRTRIPHCGGHWHDQSGARGHHGNLCRLLGCGFLGSGGRDGGDIPAFVSLGSDCCAHPQTPSRQ